MLLVHHKHRYFRIQVCVTVAVSMLVYLAAKAGLIGASNHTSSMQTLSLPLFSIGPVLAACVLAYFQNGALRLTSVIAFAVLIYGVVLVWPFVIASNEGDASFAFQEGAYFTLLNLVGFLVLGGVTAWLGKLVGILTLAAFSFSAYSGKSEQLVLTPVLALLNVTSPVSQWIVALAFTASSFLAGR